MNSLVPTIIEKGKREAWIATGDGTVKTDKDYTKILCSNDPSLFRWIRTDTKEMRFLTGCRQIGVPGSSVGRANNLGKTITGRVHDSTTYKGLYIHDSGFKLLHVTEFELLTYNCSINLPQSSNETIVPAQ